ncbi:hypothetical protein ANANG_G00151080 [Anguilla anguilla]|uniref:Uncharacterized protein n=1 Tax=Anguilla anguilla TaxID=7936 RepID=A0A9D3M6M9_ANGAN|nr:hypothetical protein ANANG_G00151080 [Anguilla anguilla]
MKMTKTSHRRRLTDEHLRSILRISSAQSLSPGIGELASKKRCQSPGACGRALELHVVLHHIAGSWSSWMPP